MISRSSTGSITYSRYFLNGRFVRCRRSRLYCKLFCRPQNDWRCCAARNELLMFGLGGGKGFAPTAPTALENNGPIVTPRTASALTNVCQMVRDMRCKSSALNVDNPSNWIGLFRVSKISKSCGALKWCLRPLLDDRGFLCVSVGRRA
jgi:hypothetical protein